PIRVTNRQHRNASRSLGDVRPTVSKRLTSADITQREDTSLPGEHRLQGQSQTAATDFAPGALEWQVITVQGYSGPHHAVPAFATRDDGTRVCSMDDRGIEAFTAQAPESVLKAVQLFIK